MEYLKVGLVRKPHGLKGDLKILPLTDTPERFKLLSKIYIGESEGSLKEVEIDKVKSLSPDLILHFKEIYNRTVAEDYRNLFLFISREEGEPLGEWEFYTQDLVGCKIIFENKVIGNVVSVDNSGANDNLVIDVNSKEFYFPFLEDYIESVDIENKVIHITEYEGFFD